MEIKEVKIQWCNYVRSRATTDMDHPNSREKIIQNILIQRKNELSLAGNEFDESALRSKINSQWDTIVKQYDKDTFVRLPPHAVQRWKNIQSALDTRSEHTYVSRANLIVWGSKSQLIRSGGRLKENIFKHVLEDLTEQQDIDNNMTLNHRRNAEDELRIAKEPMAYLRQ